MSSNNQIGTTSSSSDPESEVTQKEEKDRKEANVSSLDLRPQIKRKVKQLVSDYWLRPRSQINYKALSKSYDFGWPKGHRQAICRQCFRSNSQDIHLELQDGTHSVIEMVFKGKASPPDQKKKKIWVNVYEALVNEKTKRSFVRKVCRQVIEY